MAKKVFLSHIDLTLNQLLSALLENLASDPTGTESRIYYNTVSKKVKYYNGTTWLTVIDDLDSRLTNARTPTSHVIATNVGLGGEHTISGAAAGYVLRALSATTAAMAQLQHSDLGGIGSNTHSQIDTHLADATKHFLINDSGTLTNEVFSASKVLALIAAVNSSAAGGLVNKGGYNAATDTPALDTTPGPLGILNGWTYVVTAAGNFFAEAVQVGDMVIAKQDAPTTLAHWTVVNKNIPDIVQATETVQGIAEIATQAETDTGTDDQRFVTPLKLKTNLGITGTLSNARKFTQVIPGQNGVLTTFDINHGIPGAVTAQVFRTATPFDYVDTEIVVGAAGHLTVNFNVAPAATTYSIVVTG